eukprot:Blabericola_migrator_1__12971@NODE_860_length_6237_cov_124_199352_g610_i0_p2_GENE_NODE_860_length_6237_cov_124_199352_g610_i0NODE_860_length_6237_cov_124_199352_g610_i0_p2_ORF_typecomplete_len305_score18_94_NODE_860_length_6237_cov_124_199352_g610_i08091723
MMLERQLMECLLPYLPARIRLKLARAGSSELRQLILSPRWECEALIEYAKCADMYDLLKTWTQKPFQLTLPQSTVNGARLRERLITAMRDGIKSWHLACVRARKVSRIRLCDKVSVVNRVQNSQNKPKTFEQLADDPSLQLMTMGEAMDQLSTFPKWGGNPSLTLLLKSGKLSLDKLMKIPPVDLICWAGCMELPRMSSIPPLSEVWTLIDPSMFRMDINAFYSWKYVAETPLMEPTEEACKWQPPLHWTHSLIKQVLPEELKRIGFLPCVACVDPPIHVILFERDRDVVKLHGRTGRCVISLS